MNQGTSPAPAPKKSNTWLIVVLVIIVLCCICAVVAFGLWQYGDQLLKSLGVTF